MLVIWFFVNFPTFTRINLNLHKSPMLQYYAIRCVIANKLFNLQLVSDRLPDLFCRLADFQIPYLPISLPISEDDTFRQA